MNFLEANRILATFAGGPSLPIQFAASGNVDPILLYIRAAAASRGRKAELRTLPFGTLGQALLSSPPSEEREIILLLPWDIVLECDWRSGIPKELPQPHVLLESAQPIFNRLKDRKSKMMYLPAPLPPLYADPLACSSLSAGIAGLVSGLGAHFLDPSCFALGNYLASGVPIAGDKMGEVAETVIKLCVSGTDGSAKVLVTDLDNVLWAGLAAEDGPDGIKCSSEGIGFRHFVYQSFLARLKANGVLLAAVSRNDLEVARAPITTGKTLLSENDFIEILASYDAKSAHIRRLTESLNLGMDAFVFVDDNPIELAEVGSALPAITCRQFPSQDDKLAQFLNDLNALFARSTISEEDRQRTEMYRRRQTVAAQTSLGKEGTDLTDFLANLQMELVIQDRSSGDRERAVQLINKTNQFNLNGRRVTDDEVSRILSAGGKLYTAKLTDRTGSHGEILVCLVDEHNKILSFVLSCRVFQRRVEHAFTCWIVRRLGNNLAFTYRATERNTPIRDFLKDPAFKIQGEEGRLDGDSFQRDHGKTLELFRLQEVGFERT